LDWYPPVRWLESGCLELRVAIEEFIKRYPRFELDPSKDVTWAPGQVRALAHFR